jgi:hypothetical protein
MTQRDLRELGRIIGLKTIEIEKRWLDRTAAARGAYVPCPGGHEGLRLAGGQSGPR